jgi:phosphoenolpyruvate carboxykinase (ATP)
MSIQHTRAMVTAALAGHLDRVNYHPHPIYKIWIPSQVPEVPVAILNPENTWDDRESYRLQALELAHRFIDNFTQFGKAAEAIAQAGPTLGF